MDAGYKLRAATHAPLNEYLLSIGQKPMHNVTVKASKEAKKQ